MKRRLILAVGLGLVLAAAGSSRAAEADDKHSRQATASELKAPYPPSPVIRALLWDEGTVKIGSGTGDNWPITRIADNQQITAWGDGPGFDEQPPRLSLGFARISGNPPEVSGQDFASDADTLEGGGSSAIKASGLLMVDGTLYLWVRNYRPPGSKDFTHARLAWSTNQGTHWTWADWHFADTFGCPEFIQFGPDYSGAQDDYVYVVSQGNDSAYGYSPDIVLARVPKGEVPERAQYEFFAGFSEKRQPIWSRDLEKRKPIFTDANGTQRIAITYNAGLKRYLLTTSHRPPGSKATHTAALGVFDAPEPWGPWTTVYYNHHWSGDNRTYHHKFPTQWMSPDGRTLWLLYSGLDGGLYTFCLKRARLELNESQAPHARLRPPAIDAVRWTNGFWAERFELCHRTVLPSMKRALLDPNNAARLSNFRVGAGLEEGRHAGVNWSDGDCYKWIEAMAWVFALTHDPALDREMDEWIDLIARTQAPDGYLCTQVQLNPGKQRWEKRSHHELYNMGHLLTAASVHHATTGKTNFLAVACKLADYLDGVFRPRPKQLAHYGWNPSNIMGLVDLYRATGERRYLELAAIFVDMRGSEPWPGGNPWSNVATEDPHPGDQTQDRVWLRKETQAVGHAVTGAYLYCGAADVAMETGDQALIEALERIWRDMTGTKMYVTGAIGAYRHGLSPRFDKVHEAFGWAYDLPQRRGYNETCANLGNAMWNWRLLMLTGEARYADVMERVLYNSGLSPMSLNGTRFCYCNPLTRRRGLPLENHDTAERWFTHSCYCCPPSMARSLARLHTWAYSLSEDALWVNLYGGSTLDESVSGGQRWRVTQTTDYPWDGAIRLEIHQAPANAAVCLRIPEWCEGASLQINGKAAAQRLQPGSYVRVPGPWHSGDVLELNLPMSVTLVESHPLVEQTRGQVAVQRGPILYCLESVDLPTAVSIDDIVIPREAQWAVQHQPGLLGGVTALATDALVRPQQPVAQTLYRRMSSDSLRPQRIQMVPYYAWNNRGPTDMSVWLPAH